MRDLQSVLMSYKAALQSQQIVLTHLEKSSKSSMFHNTVFFKEPYENVKGLMGTTKEDTEDLFILLLVSTFEHVIFNHPNSPLDDALTRKGVSDLTTAITILKDRVSSRTYDAVAQLCRYRNWIAHGRRWQATNDESISRPVDPEVAHAKLVEFLTQADLMPAASP